MSQFCPVCKTLLKYDGKVWSCPRCERAAQNNSKKLSKRIAPRQNNLEDIADPLADKTIEYMSGHEIILTRQSSEIDGCHGRQIYEYVRAKCKKDVVCHIDLEYFANNQDYSFSVNRDLLKCTNKNCDRIMCCFYVENESALDKRRTKK